MCAPTGVPAPTVSRVADGIAQALKTPEVQKRLEDLGVDVHFMAPHAFATYFRAETSRWAKVVKAAKIEGQ